MDDRKSTKERSINKVFFFKKKKKAGEKEISQLIRIGLTAKCMLRSRSPSEDFRSVGIHDDKDGKGKNRAGRLGMVRVVCRLKCASQGDMNSSTKPGDPVL